MVKSGKIQKKEFYEVKFDLTSSKIFLYASSAEQLNGKIVKMDLTRSLRGKSLELKVKVKLEDGVLKAEPTSIELAGSYIRRAFRKGADYVEDSFVVQCNDCRAIVKPFMLTRNKVSREVRRVLRDSSREFLINHIKNRSSKEMFNEIMTNKIQKELSLRLKKVYPLALCEIRLFEVLAKDSELKTSLMASEQAPVEEERNIAAESKKEYLKNKADKKDEREKAEEEVRDKDSEEKKISKKSKSEKKEE